MNRTKKVTPGRLLSLILLASFLIEAAPHPVNAQERQYELVPAHINRALLIDALEQSRPRLKVPFDSLPIFTESWEAKAVGQRERTANSYDFESIGQRCLVLVRREKGEIVEFTVIAYARDEFDVLIRPKADGSTKGIIRYLAIAFARRHNRFMKPPWWDIQMPVDQTPVTFGIQQASQEKVDSINPVAPYMPAIETQFPWLAGLLKKAAAAPLIVK